MTFIAITVFVVAYALHRQRPRQQNTGRAHPGRGIVVVLGVVESADAFYSHETGIDWDVIFLLLGMMIIVGESDRPGSSNTSRSGR